MTKKRIIVAHPEKQHSYRLVEAISDMGMLDECHVIKGLGRKFNANKK